jgi:hypothetical protein
VKEEMKKEGNEQRILWTENDYNVLLMNSYLGVTRNEIKDVLGRSTSKIFSKIQKHQKMIS